jgi:hypothetical protein
VSNGWKAALLLLVMPKITRIIFHSVLTDYIEFDFVVGRADFEKG